MSGVYRPAPASEAPEVILSKWGVFEVKEGPKTRHFYGFNELSQDGRVSSPITSFKNGIGFTRSGRLYELVGPQGWSTDGAYVLDTWLSINGLDRDDIRDVSSEYQGNDT